MEVRRLRANRKTVKASWRRLAAVGRGDDVTKQRAEWWFGAWTKARWEWRKYAGGLLSFEERRDVRL